ncbi:MAG TPA: ferrochelatase, partial [Sphingomonadales bacterium]|nr:ferrochelatase [Sphingomonadales bacterium]
MTKTAVVLFNLGGPDSLAAVEPFLFNLFSDPAIIRLPNPFRRLLAKFIAWRRAPAAGEIYKRLGGASPLAANTESQARALERALSAKGAFKVFMAMRYWHPFARETARAVKTYGAARCVLLPLYPQFSSTTTASSLADWERAAKAEGLNVPSSAVCCFPEEEKFIAAHAALIEPLLRHAVKKGPARVLFSAHGLPERVVTAGDPYVFQVEKTVAAIAATLKKKGLLKEADVALSYQSRVGPLKWIGPSIVDEIRRAGRERRNLVVVPVSFVSEHAETLVELDIESKALAAKAGVPLFFRAPALGTHNSFVASLARLVLE